MWVHAVVSGKGEELNEGRKHLKREKRFALNYEIHIMRAIKRRTEKNWRDRRDSNERSFIFSPDFDPRGCLWLVSNSLEYLSSTVSCLTKKRESKACASFNRSLTLHPFKIIFESHMVSTSTA